jgi:two-component system, NarL family, response regulator LiaR
MPQPISVAVVEDSGVYRDLLCDLCHDSAQLTLCGSFGSVQAAIEQLPKLKPDLVLVDLGLPDGHGTEIIRHLRKVGCKSECLVLTVYDDDRHLFPALEAGAIGYVLKDQADQESLIAAIQEAMRGGAPMSASIARRVLSHFGRSTLQVVQTAALTQRENEVLEQLAKGYNAKKVAQILQISYDTVRCHQRNIYKKLQVSSVVGALSAISGSSL